MITPEQFDSWIAALESGDFLQATGMLRRKRTYSPVNTISYCCLGVLCTAVLDVDLEVPSFPHSAELVGDLGGVEEAPQELVDALPNALREVLARLNDNFNFDFPQIAFFLRENRDLILSGSIENENDLPDPYDREAMREFTERYEAALVQ